MGGAIKHPAWTFIGYDAIAERNLAVDDHISYTRRVLMRLVESGEVRDRVGIEDDDVGSHAGSEDTSIPQLQALSGEA
jgi:hypothetical protein